jgi:drug/metabolite transporter (DMT)-like permease
MCVSRSLPARPAALATLAGLAAILLWSTSVALGRSIAEQVGPLNAGAAVYCFGGVAMVVWQAARRPAVLPAMLHLPPGYLLGCGGLFVFYTATFFLALGLAENAAQTLVVGLVNYLWPVLTVVLSIPILKARARWLLWPGTVVAVVGVVSVVISGQGVTLSSLPATFAASQGAFGFALAAAISWALYSNLARRCAGASAVGAVPLFVLASGLVLLAVRVLRPEAGVWSPRVLAETGFMGLNVAISYACWDKAMRQGNMLLVAACSYLTPLLSTLACLAYLKVVPAPGLWLGCLALVAGSLASWHAVDDGPE